MRFEAGSDRIMVTGLRVRAHHGVYPEEREAGQDFLIDMELTVPLAVAAAMDDVRATVHYGQLARAVAESVARDPVALIETVADRVARLALEDDRVERVRVTVHKPQAPIRVPFQDIAVTIERLPDRGEGEQVVVALGANLGDRQDTLARAVAVLRALPGVEIDRVSPALSTTALTEEGPDPARPGYLNQIVTGRSTLTPQALLATLHAVEHAFGRVREERWGDRTLDLDLIVFGDRRAAGPGLTLPHPRAHLRDFVLAPWLAIDPGAELPGRGRVADLLAALEERTLG